MNEMKDKLLLILSIMSKDTTTNEGKETQKIYLEQLLRQYEYDIAHQLNDLKHKQKLLEESLETLEYVKKELDVR